MTKFIFHKTTLVGLILGMGLVIGIAAMTFIFVNRYLTSNFWVSHTAGVIIHLERLENSLVALRDLVISGSPLPAGGRAPRAVADQVDAETRTIRQLTADNPVQQERMDALEPALALYATSFVSRTVDKDGAPTPPAA